MRTMFAPVTVYGQPNCKYCVVAVKKLEDAGVKFDYVDLTKNAEAKTYVIDVLKARMVPVVVDDIHTPIVGDNPEKLQELIDYYTASETGL
ncbi:glutaredoxin [Mycolicibacterium rhodesiae JS60]|nr:glutaredoxin [Mycolicibacterium rhodesiae JS60]